MSCMNLFLKLKIHATGVCHTDAYTLDGLDPEGIFPVILGNLFESFLNKTLYIIRRIND
jgi:hypothetical protein